MKLTVEFEVEAISPVSDLEAYEQALYDGQEDIEDKILYTKEEVEKITIDTIQRYLKNHLDPNYCDGNIPYCIMDNLQVYNFDYDLDDFVKLNMIIKEVQKE